MPVNRIANGLPVQPLVSDTAGAAPTAAELLANEIAINAADKKGFVKNIAGAVVELDFNDASIPLADANNSGQQIPSGGVAGQLQFTTATGYINAAPAAAGTF